MIHLKCIQGIVNLLTRIKPLRVALEFNWASVQYGVNAFGMKCSRSSDIKHAACPLIMANDEQIIGVG